MGKYLLPVSCRNRRWAIFHSYLMPLESCYFSLHCPFGLARVWLHYFKHVSSFHYMGTEIICLQTENNVFSCLSCGFQW